jgi:hypothetical protein
MSKINKWIKIGNCAVDSGTIMLVDPCYVLPDKITKKGKLISHHGIDSYTYEHLMVDLYGKDLNNDDKNFVEILASGIGGTGVVVHSGYGDGDYPVYAKLKEGRIKEIKIKFF